MAQKLSSKWSAPLIFFDRKCTTQNPYMPGRASNGSFYISFTMPKRTTFRNAKNYQIILAESCLQNGLHLLFKMGCTCHSKRSHLQFKVGRKSSSGWAATRLSAADGLSPTSAEARPPMGWSHLGSGAAPHPNRHPKQTSQAAPIPVAHRCVNRSHSGNEK